MTMLDLRVSASVPDKVSPCFRDESGRARRPSAEAGVALPVTLILLTIITVLAFAGFNDATLQERMAGNVRDREVAFQAAEAALRAGEQWLQLNQIAASANAVVSGVDAAAWNGASSPVPTGSRTGLYGTGDGITLAANPVFYVGSQQLLRTNPGENPPEFREIFPVIAHAQGGTDAAFVILRSTFDPL